MGENTIREFLRNDTASFIEHLVGLNYLEDVAADRADVHHILRATVAPNYVGDMFHVIMSHSERRKRSPKRFGGKKVAPRTRPSPLAATGSDTGSFLVVVVQALPDQPLVPQACRKQTSLGL